MGPRKHMKRLNAPSHWMLSKMAGRFVCCFLLKRINVILDVAYLLVALIPDHNDIELRFVTVLQAPRPSAGPHKLRECLPLIIFIRNRLKYALTYADSKWILKERQVLVDGKARTDLTYPAGLMGTLTSFLCVSLNCWRVLV
jgi:small subunit ribosomal protein S4e